MPAHLAVVVSPILHPLAARKGDLLAWYPAETIEVLRRVRGRWVIVRGLGFDNAGALAGLLADGAIEPASPSHAARIRAALAVASSPRRPVRRARGSRSH